MSDTRRPSRATSGRNLLVRLAVIAALCAASGPRQPAHAREDLPQHPLSLRDCTTIALRNNPQLISSAQGIVIARAALTEARSSYYPQIALNATEAVARDSGEQESVTTGSHLDVTSRLTLWRLGRDESVSGSRATLRASEYSHALNVQDLVSQVAYGYYAVLAARQLVAVAAGGVESAQAHLEQVRARIALGATAEVDLFTAESDLAQARLDLIGARSGLGSALAQLKYALGVGAEAVIDLQEDALPEGVETPSLSEALAVAAQHRPEILAGQALAETSRCALAQVRIAAGPVPEATIEYAPVSTDGDTRETSWTAGLSLSWSLFDGYASRAEVEIARANVTDAEADLQRAVDQVGLEVEEAVVEAQRAQESVVATAASVEAAEAQLAAAEGKYEQGVGILIEVTDARVAVTNARASQVQARYDEQTARIELQRAMGTLAVPEGEGG